MNWLRRIWQKLFRRKPKYVWFVVERKMGLRPVRPQKLIPILYKREKK